jgi:hypothetical protein
MGGDMELKEVGDALDPARFDEVSSACVTALGYALIGKERMQESAANAKARAEAAEESEDERPTGTGPSPAGQPSSTGSGSAETQPSQG